MDYQVSSPDPDAPQEGTVEAGASKRALLHALEKRVAEIEKRPLNFGGETQAAEPVSPADETGLWRFGVAAVDTALPQGRLDPHGLHDVTAESFRLWPSAIGFGLALLGRLPGADTGPAKTILWCQSRRMMRESGRLYGHGLSAFGLDPARLILVLAEKEKDALWAVEEGVRTAGIAAVVGEVGEADFTATRRLVLACMENRRPALLLRPPHKGGGASAASTRWRIGAHAAAPDPWDTRLPLHPRWRAELFKCRGGKPGAWTVEWNYETHRFSLAAELADRTVQPGGKEREMLQSRAV